MTQAAAAMLTLAEAQRLLPGSRLVGDGGTAFARVHSDTRSLRPGDLFVALRGERFDAHAFLAAARQAGAAAALAEHGLADAGLPGLETDDALAALQTLAAAWRARHHGPLVAVTGSNGKTTVTQMVAALLRAWLGDAAFATAGNLNNHIGVPLTLLGLRTAAPDGAAGHRAAVVELGMNHPGEIAALAALAAPTVALVNNAQREHQEFMAGVEAVARENGAVIEALGADGTAVFPADDEYAPLWRGLAGARRTLTFALDGAAGQGGAPAGGPVSAAPALPAGLPVPADVTARAVWKEDHWALALRTPQGVCEATLALPGLHNVRNALAAVACALAAGAPLDAVPRGLSAFVPVKGRSQARRLLLRGRQVTLVDDSYNANPDSVRAAVDVLASLPGPHWLVLGDMGEVGAQGVEFHREVGAYARARGIESLWTLGRLATHAAEAHARARHFDDMTALLAALANEPHFASLLVKGSRFMRMEQVVAALLAEAEAAAHAHAQRLAGVLVGGGAAVAPPAAPAAPGGPRAP